MTNANLPPNPEDYSEVRRVLEERLAVTAVIPPDMAMHYREPVNDQEVGQDWRYDVSNEHTFGKLEQHVRPDDGTAAFAVGPTQGYQLLGMYPELTGLQIIDISDSAVTTARAIPELLLRAQQLTGRIPTGTELVEILRGPRSAAFGDHHEAISYTPPLATRILALPLAVTGQQHTFSPQELRTADWSKDVIADDLYRQLSSRWLQPKALEHITAMYRNGHIQVNRGNIFGGEAMDHLRQQSPPFGVVYVSNIIQVGYGALHNLSEITRAFEQLPFGASPLFVQAAGNIVGPDDRYWQRQHSEDWAYLVLLGKESFVEYLRADNPDLAAGRWDGGGVTVKRYPAWSGRNLLFSSDGLVVEQPR